MGFSNAEKETLLALNGVGPTVVKRFEEIGINSFSELREHDVEEIAERVSDMLRSSCWKNSPLARKSIRTAINCARMAGKEAARE